MKVRHEALTLMLSVAVIVPLCDCGNQDNEEDQDNGSLAFDKGVCIADLVMIKA